MLLLAESLHSFHNFSADFHQGFGDSVDFLIDTLQKRLQLRFRVQYLHVLRVRIVTNAEGARDRLRVGASK